MCKTLVTCSLNEVYSECGDNGCQPTCMDLVGEPATEPCIPYCVTHGCICAAGLIRDTDTGRCVPPSLCSNLG